MVSAACRELFRKVADKMKRGRCKPDNIGFVVFERVA